MMDSEHTSNQNSSEEALDELFAEYVDRLVGGEILDLQKIAQDHPMVADVLIDRLKMYQGMEEGRGVQHPLGILGDYTLRRQIGRGGMGVVYEAWQGSMDRVVALKLLPAGVAADNKAFMRFMREAKTAGQLNHQNVVAVYSTGVEEGTPWYSMEYVEGETLAQIQARLKNAPENTKTPFGFPRDNVTYYSILARCFAEVADGLQHAHSKGVIHRDIKPSNLILDAKGRLRILDFGLARLEGQESLTISGDFLGTVLYMSPEQAMAKRIRIDHRTDIYSLGATMYEMLACQPPFQGKHHQDTLSQIILRDPQSPRQLNSRIPRDLETIALKCLRKDPADRYGTAEALSQDLRRFIRGDPIEARPQATLDKLIRYVVHQRWKLTVVFTTLVLVLIIAWLSWQHSVALHQTDLASYESRVLEAFEKIRMRELSLRASGGKAVLLKANEAYVPFLTSVDLSVLTWDRLRNAIEKAVDDLALLVQRVPDRIEALYYRARALVVLEREDEARQDLQRILECKPDFVPAVALMHELAGGGDANGLVTFLKKNPAIQDWKATWLMAQSATLTRNWQKAAEAFEELLDQLDSREPYLGAAVEFRMDYAVALKEIGELTAAIRELNRAWGPREQFFEPALLLSKIYYLRNFTGDREEADRILDKLYALSDLKDETALWIAALYRSLKEDSKGLKWARSMKESSIRKRLEAIFLIHLCKFQEAVAAGREAVNLNRRDPNAYTILALAIHYHVWHRGRGDGELIQEGIDACERALEIDQKQSTARALLAYAHLHRGDSEKARELTNYLIQHEPKNPYGYIVQSEAHLLERNIFEAVSQARQAVNRDPNLVHARLQLGTCLSAQGSHEEALAEFEIIIALEPAYQWAWGGKASQLHELKRYDEALEAYRKAFVLQDFSPGRHSGCARTLTVMGRSSEAMKEYCKVLEQMPDSYKSDERLCSLLLQQEENRPIKEFSHLLELLERDLDFASVDYRRLCTLALLQVAISGKNNLPIALNYSMAAVNRSNRKKPMALATLARIQYESGDVATAVKTLKEAVELPGALPIVKQMLNRYRGP